MTEVLTLMVYFTAQTVAEKDKKSEIGCEYNVHINTTFLVIVSFHVIALLAQLLFLFMHNLPACACCCCFSFSHCTMVLHTLHKTIVNTAHVTVL